MGERGQKVGLSLEVAHDHLVHRGVSCQVEHLLDSHQLGYVGEMQVSALVNRAHAASAQNPKHQVPVLEGHPRLELAELPSLGLVILKGSSSYGA